MGGVSYVESAANPQEAENELVLPGFIEQRPDGVYVDLTRISSSAEFERIVERIFSAGKILRDLDYDRFQHLLYRFNPSDRLLSVCLASEIAEFPEARRALYHAVKIADGKAEYLFEPVQLETSAEVPVFGANEEGEQVVVGVERMTIFEPTQLNFDEFIAAAWKNGLRFGIDADRVRELIHSGNSERAIIASSLPPTEGVDAGVKEQTDLLHRDNAPRKRSDGRIELQQFTNRFPQIKEGTRLLMKTPRQLGEAGRNLNGAYIEPRLPNDLALDSVAGEGTRIENIGGAEYIVAAMDGFLNVDTKANSISVTKKIINREGISARTTGNLVLQGDEYEEFGEVQEGRTIEGKSLTFHADVFGHVVSTGGNILFEQNLVGGTALNRDGEIVVQGLASSAVLQSSAGVVRVKRVENCVLIADRVELEWAGRSTILANEVEIGSAEGCAIAGKQVHIGVASSHRGEETLVSMLLPDLSSFERLQQEFRRQIDECQKTINRIKEGITTLTTQPEIEQYLAMVGKLRRKEVILTPPQVSQLQQLTARMAPAMKRLQRAREEIGELEGEMAKAQTHVEQCERDKQAAGSGIACTIDAVRGDVSVRPLIVGLDAPPLKQLPAKELRAKLRGLPPDMEVLFAGNQGSFSWVNVGPDGEAPSAASGLQSESAPSQDNPAHD